MTKDEVRQLAVDALQKTANVFSDPKVSAALGDPTADVQLVDLGIDSLDKVEWCIAMEEQSGLQIDPALVEQCTTLNDVVEMVAARAGELAR